MTTEPGVGLAQPAVGTAGLRRFKPYPAYKDSGVEWLGEIPAHWEVKRLKYLGDAITGLTYEPADVVGPDDQGALVLRASNVADGRIVLEDTVFVRCAILDRLRTKVGDILICSRSGSRALIGKSAKIHPAAVGLTFGAFMTVFRSVCNDYLFYVFNSTLFDYQSGACLTSTINQLTLGNLKGLTVPVPRDSERSAIAAFLDGGTARIDALLAKKERLIELLQEKRTALITRVVTKGLDPNVPMKDSGVEWLGQIPAHWGVKPLKRCVRFVEGPGIMAADFTNNGVPLLRIAGIGGRTVTLDGCNYLAPDLVRRRWKHFRVRSGDLLISGSASTGFCSEVDAEAEGAIPYTGIIVMRPRVHTTEKAFLRWFLLSGAFSTQTDLARSGSAIQHFGPSHLSRMGMVVPPPSAQSLIAAFLDRETARIDVLVAKVREAIDRLKELRTALISAAVTGKIDVRGMAQ